MKKTLNVLIADDLKRERGNIKKHLNKYYELEKNIQFQILETSTVSETEKILSLQGSKFDIIFMDINFSEGELSKKDLTNAGLDLIELAFSINPLNVIATISNNIHGTNNSAEITKLTKTGKISELIRKDQEMVDKEGWFNKPLERMIELVNTRKYLNDIISNHRLILEKISPDELKKELNDYLNPIIDILKEIDSNSDKEAMFRLLILLIHICLEKYSSAKNTDEEIHDRLKDNISTLNKMLSNEIRRDISHIISPKRTNRNGNNYFKQSALEKILALHIDERVVFGDKLNQFRNYSTHFNNALRPTICHVLFAHLTLLVYIVDDRSTIKFSNIKNLDLKDQAGYEDFRSIVNYISQK